MIERLGIVFNGMNELVFFCADGDPETSDRAEKLNGRRVRSLSALLCLLMQERKPSQQGTCCGSNPYVWHIGFAQVWHGPCIRMRVSLGVAEKACTDDAAPLRRAVVVLESRRFEASVASGLR